jgi:hypothetical protein
MTILMLGLAYVPWQVWIALAILILLNIVIR